MLKQRIFTACALLAVFLITLFWMPSGVFVFFFSAVFLLGAWEWSDLSDIRTRSLRISYVLICALACLGVFYITDYSSNIEAMKTVFFASFGWWLLALVFIRLFPQFASFWRPKWVRALAGAFVLIPGWLAVQYLLHHPSGGSIILLCLLTVCAVDVGAYFSGRRFGRRKLAPQVSPGKSWEGVFGGLTLSVAVAILYVALLSDKLNVITLMLIVLPAAISSIVGDLLESMVKRERGVKDSSAILPGHGGVLDRVDGMLPAIPIFSLAVILTGWQL